MGFVKGIDAIRERVESSSKDYSDSPRAKWLKLADNQSVKINFLQELDENSSAYSEKNGPAVIALEHSHPDDYQKKALCTADEGPCLGCEMNAANPKGGWYQKTRFYANALITNGKEDPYVAVVSQGIGPKSITPMLLEVSTEYGSITENTFRIKRNGAGFNNTSYTLLALPGKPDIDVESYELYNLSEVATRSVPYEEQAEFYGIELGADGALDQADDESAYSTDTAW